MRNIERTILLQVLDRKWREHLYEMDYLKEGIGLRAMAQRDPLIEYQREGYDMFQSMLDGLKEETVQHLFSVRIEVETPQQQQVQPAEVPAAFARAAEAAAQAQADGNGRHRIQDPAPQPPQPQVPPALRGGMTQPQQLNYSGPAEDGGVESHTEGADGAGGGSQSGTRRERRAAARANAKKGRKGPRR
ncbi:hypothetical protein [Kibdelosporangium aridum]|uniref:hypothetical protein n=1 Tax=Kibdelosporangium aridum TaxID=2030 RepID=UPI0035ED9B0D